MRPLRRVLPLLALATFVLAGCGDTYQVAARIADQEYGYDELEARVESWTANPNFVSAITGGYVPTDPGSGRIDQTVVLTILGLAASSEAAQQFLDANDIEIDPLIVQQLSDQLPELAPEFDEADSEWVVDLYAPLVQASEVGADYPPLPADEVYISSRLGSYDSANGAVTPPDGPQVSIGTFDQGL